MIYLLLVILAAILHSSGFFFNSKVEKNTKPGFSSAIIFATVSWMEILFSLLIIMRGEIAFTPFSLIISAIHSLLVIICSFIALKALIFADVAKYSLYMMLGGMLVPFVFGITFLKEEITLGKTLCCVVIILSLITDNIVSQKADSKKNNRRSFFYLILLFFINGSFGVLTTIHQNSNSHPHVDAMQYMLLRSVFIVSFGIIFLICRFIFLYVSKRNLQTSEKQADSPKKPSCQSNVLHKRAYIYMLAYGIVYGIAEILLLYSIEHIDASVQYPAVSGATIVCSTLISLFSKEKTTKKCILPMIIALIGISMLFIPI